ncbi:soil-associated protein, TIGR03435 family [Bryocella elongata]|uniref:Soil-associated protein, TIGR03435 family n=1 Tax=Bryocella elongata TaxID=863522 RepID=A0A1H5Y4D8_9BACT|nr:TIGR03435 family protein [Bryocella elongata]SEG18470.1 soil-associated protein, TIGR03435 family [Bryocella elongata]
MRDLLRLVAAPFAFCVLFGIAASAQELAMAPPGSPRLSFDVVSVRPSAPPQPRQPCFIKGTPGGFGYQARCINVKTMIALMYKIPARQITSSPSWVNDELFDIDAKADKAYSLDDLHAMFQDLLADRFGLRFHTEKKEGNIYALTIDSSGLKMKPNTSAENFQIPFQGSIDGFTGIRVPMNYLCWQLGQFLQNDERPVVNMTGLTGNYDFKLVFLPELPPGIDKDALPPGFLDRPSLFTAVREQLGLKLTPQKGPVTYLVIDHIEKPTDKLRHLL